MVSFPWCGNAGGAPRDSWDAAFKEQRPGGADEPPPRLFLAHGRRPGRPRLPLGSGSRSIAFRYSVAGRSSGLQAMAVHDETTLPSGRRFPAHTVQGLNGYVLPPRENVSLVSVQGIKSQCLVTAVVPAYRCGAATDSHRVPSCGAPIGGANQQPTTISGGARLSTPQGIVEFRGKFTEVLRPGNMGLH